MPDYWRGLTIFLFFYLVFLCEAFKLDEGVKIDESDNLMKVISIHRHNASVSENKKSANGICVSGYAPFRIDSVGMLHKYKPELIWSVVTALTLTPERAKISDNRCKLGTTYSEKHRKCIAFCPSGCENGNCIDPGKCSCDPPFILKHNNACVKRPLNSICGDTLESCRCNDGLRMDNGKCVPVCSSECINGYCESTNNCSCHDGYVKNKTNQNICYEASRDDIKYARCTLGGECFCYCTANGVKHYIIKLPMANNFQLYPCRQDIICEAKCSHECINGTCVGPDVCACEPPLQLIDKYTCIEPEVENKVYDCLWWLVCCVSVLLVTAISFLCCIHSRTRYYKGVSV